MKKITKDKAISIVVECAKKYEKNLVDKTVMFVCIDKYKKVSYVELEFIKSNFLHLTGCKVKNGLSAKDFYNRCINGKLGVDDFELSQDGTTELKLEILSILLEKNLSANLIGDYKANNPKLYTEKIAGGVKAGMGIVLNKKGKYVPNTALNIDVRQYVSDYVRIIATYIKNKDEDKYYEQVYKAKKVNWDEIKYSKEIDDLILYRVIKINK